MVEHLTQDAFEESVSKADQPVIVDFYADWCGPCKRLAPIFEELSKEVDGVKFFKVNVEDESELAGTFAVQSIPTLILFKDGKPKERLLGLIPKEELKSAIEAHK